MNTIFNCKKLLLAVFSIIGLTLLSGCGGGGNTPSAVTLNSIAVTPSSLTVAHGTTASLGATGIYTDGSTADLTSQVTWVSVAPATATVNSNGVVSGLAVGTTTITATLNGITSPSVSISVTAATLNSIAITPSSVSLAKGTNTNLSAIGTYSDGSSTDISTQVTWTSALPATATVGMHTGTVTGASVGSTTVSASLSGITSPDANITVTDAILSSIAVTGATLPKGTNANLSATGTYSDSTTADITAQVTWTSADPLTATVGSNTGIVIGTAVGTTTVTATLSGITSNTATIDVIAATLSSIAITPAPVSLAKGTSTNLLATGTYSDLTTADITTQVSWLSDAPAKASVGAATGVVQANTVGSANISASLNGVNAPSISVTVTPATWNPADMGTEVYLTNGNLTAKSTFPDWYRAVRATVGVSSGKAYWEITPIYNAAVFGIMGPAANLESWVGEDAYGWGLYPVDGTLRGSGMVSGWVATVVPYGSVIGFGLDMDAGTLRIWVNGIDRGIAFTGLTGTIYPASTIYADGVIANFGATPFVTNPLPDGYNADVFQH